jgi:hypothetical protein
LLVRVPASAAASVCSDASLLRGLGGLDRGGVIHGSLVDDGDDDGLGDGGGKHSLLLEAADALLGRGEAGNEQLNVFLCREELVLQIVGCAVDILAKADVTEDASDGDADEEGGETSSPGSNGLDNRSSSLDLGIEKTTYKKKDR